MTGKSKKVVGALSAGMIAGAGIGMLGSYMMSHKSSVKKTAKKASKAITEIIDGLQGMM
jgi:hypothetical protein